MPGNSPATMAPSAPRQRTGERLVASGLASIALDAVPGWDQPGAMPNLKSVTSTSTDTGMTCQAMVTVKGKPRRCDQPATTTRLSVSGGRPVCLKHDRAVWVEYVKTSLP
jgi:hypothetical protein